MFTCLFNNSMCLTRCVAKNIDFLKSHCGYLANSADPDQPASAEAEPDQDLHLFISAG